MTDRLAIFRFGAALPLLFSLSCKSGNDTSIIVHVVSDDTLGLDYVDMSARSISTTPTPDAGGHTTTTTTAHFPNPRQVTWVLSPQGSDRTFSIEVEAKGMKNGATAPVVAQRAVVAFRPGQHIEITMSLTQACVGVSCASPLTCSHGTCIDPGTLQPPPVDNDGSTASDARDAAVDQPLERAPDARADVVDVRADVPGSGNEDGGAPDTFQPKAIGDSCGADGQCASNHCVDGLCCDSACTGSCQQCDTVATPGRCVTIAAGQPAPAKRAPCAKDDVSTCRQTGFCDGKGACQLYADGQLCRAASCDPTANTLTESRCDGMGACVPGTALSCAPFRCKAGDTACARTCMTTADCDGQPCLANSCGKLMGGATCTADTDCLLGFCVDCVCCDGRCGGQCQACNLSGTVGICSSVKSGQPVGGRPVCTGTGTCGGSCGGQATCVYPPTSLSCRPASCDVSTLTSPASCNGSGACPAVSTSACPNHLRCQPGGTACLAQCTTTSDCVAGFFCSGTTCTATKALGTGCGAGSECASGFCTDGVCCNVQCNGTCTTCGTGTCVQVKNADDDSCMGASTCSAVGTCLKKQGQACSVTTDCAAGVCADGVCCNMACAGQCESCSNGAVRGVCGAVTTPRTPCAGAGTSCVGHCDGTQRAACVYPGSSTSCGVASCSAGTNTGTLARSCGGDGTCSPIVTVPCGAFGCNGTACGSNCPTGQSLCSGACVDVLSTPTHCGVSCTVCGGTTPKCQTGSCVQCIVAGDCAGAGSTCTTNHTCACRQKSVTNLLVNPGFDQPGVLTPWTASGGASLATDDADGCPGSGSVQALVTMPAFDFGHISQCVQVSALTAYSFGFKYKQPANAFGVCMLETFADANCATSSIHQIVIQTPQSTSAVDWTSIASTAFQPVNGEQSVLVICQTDTAPPMFFDQLYLNTAGSFY